jgi:hypothetical protein
MKISIKVLIALAIASASITSQAQIGLEFFQSPRVAVLVPAQNVLSNSTVFTNNPVETRLFVGTVGVSVTGFTNIAGGTMTLGLETSADTTNWTTVTNIAAAVSGSVISTNGYYGGTNLTATNTWLFSGLYTTPTAWSAGTANPYFSPYGFTNTTVTVSSGTYYFGLQSDGLKRYVHAILTPGGTATNWSGGAIIIGRTSTEVK